MNQNVIGVGKLKIWCVYFLTAVTLDLFSILYSLCYLIYSICYIIIKIENIKHYQNICVQFMDKAAASVSCWWWQG